MLFLSGLTNLDKNSNFVKLSHSLLFFTQKLFCILYHVRWNSYHICWVREEGTGNREQGTANFLISAQTIYIASD